MKPFQSQTGGRLVKKYMEIKEFFEKFIPVAKISIVSFPAFSGVELHFVDIRKNKLFDRYYEKTSKTSEWILNEFQNIDCFKKTISEKTLFINPSLLLAKMICFTSDWALWKTSDGSCFPICSKEMFENEIIPIMRPEQALLLEISEDF